MNRRVSLVKFGGGLITDKSVVETPRRDVIANLAHAFAEARATSDCSWVLGHGSGSFGHQAASGSILAKPAHSPPRACESAADRLAVSRTADAAARLHRIVVDALLASSVPCFSWLVSSVASGSSGRPANCARGLIRLLVEGLVPVTMGDVVVGGPGGTEIWSTERVLSLVAKELAATGWKVDRVLWFGNTDGILDARGVVIDEIDSNDLEGVRSVATGSAGVDVTGGMRLRLDTCAALAASGVESWVLDGRRLDVVAAAFAGTRLGGTRFAGASADRRSVDRALND